LKWLECVKKICFVCIAIGSGTLVLQAKSYTKISYYVAYDKNDSRQYLLVMPSVKKMYAHQAGKITASDLHRIDQQFETFPLYKNGELCFPASKKEGATSDLSVKKLSGKCFDVKFFYIQKESLPEGMDFMLLYDDNTLLKVYEGLAGKSESFKIVRDGEKVFDTNSLSGEHYLHFYFDKAIPEISIDPCTTVDLATNECKESNDTTPPSLTLIGAEKIVLDYNSTFIDAGILINDNVDNYFKVSTRANVDTLTPGFYKMTYRVSDYSGNVSTITREWVVKNANGSLPHYISEKEVALLIEYRAVPTAEAYYDALPKGKALTDALARRFLNKATFGATETSVKHLQKIGILAWMKEAFKQPYIPNEYLKKTILLAKAAEPKNNTHTVEEYLADNVIVFNKNVASFHSPRYMMSAWFDIALTSESQLRHKVAYALSQIIVESDFEPLFTRRGEALSHYFDLLAKNTFGTYKQLLTDITFSSDMGLFLTYNGNKKVTVNEANVSVYPDENYAREIMQLFSIGLYQLNLDGTPKTDEEGNSIATYTQEDVNELARVFTGWDTQRSGKKEENRGDKYGRVGFLRGDFTHPMEFTERYHDFGAKKVLGETIAAGLSGKEDIHRAIDIIMRNSSAAPFLSRQLIMRLAKSNPSPAYVARVATVFINSNGRLPKVIEAILLDKELWSDMKAFRSIKFKEPLIAYTSYLRALHVKPLPYWYFCRYGGPENDEATNCQKIEKMFLFNTPVSYLGEGPGRAPTVFNFYDNGYVPNDSLFKADKSVAPEIEIQNDTMLIRFNNQIRKVLDWEKTYMEAKKRESLSSILKNAPHDGNIPLYYIGSDKYLVDLKEDYEYLSREIDGTNDGNFSALKDEYQKGDREKIESAVKSYIGFVDDKLLGGLLSKAEKKVLYEALTENQIYNHWAGDDSPDEKRKQIMEKVILPLYRSIVTSEIFMTE